jgi:hypothetical protein
MKKDLVLTLTVVSTVLAVILADVNAQQLLSRPVLTWMLLASAVINATLGVLAKTNSTFKDQ